MSGGSGVSLKPSDAQAGGGLFDDIDARIERMYFRLWDYNGSIPTPVLGLAAVYAPLDGGASFEQVYSAGDTKFLVPSPDGKEAIPVSTERTGLMDGTNAIQYLTSIMQAGFPEAKVGKDVSVFEGTVVHLNRVPQQKRPGIKPVAGKEGKKDDILIVTKIHAYPWDAAGSVAAPAPAAAAAKTKAKAAPAVAGQTVAPAAAASEQAAAPGASEAVQNRAIEVVMQILSETGGTVPKAAIAGKAFKILNDAKDPLRNEVSQLVFKDGFLGQAGQPWAFDGTTVSFGG